MRRDSWECNPEEVAGTSLAKRKAIKGIDGAHQGEKHNPTLMGDFFSQRIHKFRADVVKCPRAGSFRRLTVSAKECD